MTQHDAVKLLQLHPDLLMVACKRGLTLPCIVCSHILAVHHCPQCGDCMPCCCKCRWCKKVQHWLQAGQRPCFMNCWTRKPALPVGLPYIMLLISCPCTTQPKPSTAWLACSKPYQVTASIGGERQANASPVQAYQQPPSSLVGTS